MLALQYRREQPQQLPAAAPVHDADVELAVIGLCLRADQKPAAVAGQVADRDQPCLLEGVLRTVADYAYPAGLERHQRMQYADDIRQLACSNGIAQPFVTAGIHILGHLSIKAIGNGCYGQSVCS